MALDAASYEQLWRISNDTGVLPEYLLPVLYFESGFDPSRPNSQGYPYFGLDQASADLISQYAGTDPQTYLTWPASAQLRTVVYGFIKSLVHEYGKIRSATRLYQANFYPASLNTAHSLDATIVSAPSAAYNANAGLDQDKKGTITVRDLAAVMLKSASSHAVQSAIATAYATKGRYAPLDVGVTGVSGFGYSGPIDPPMMDGDVMLVTQRLPPIGLGVPSPEDVNHIVYGDDFGFWQMHPELAKLSIAASVLTASWLAVKSGWVRRYL